ncbi:ATP-NAD kinase-like domain-containing protein [Lenzites betulinus]|nr:ATP-NAD kinase-like domain-containing protein [Lenzites betulinus]
MSSSSLTLGRGPSASTLTLHDGALLVHRAADTKWPKVRVPVRDVLWAGVEDGLFELSMLARRKRTSPYSLLHITGAVSDADHAAAAAFADTLMTAAYPVLKRQRRLKVFVNPKSGPGKAASLYRKRIEPIFRAARCDVDLTFTCRGKQAQEIIETLPLDEFDAVVVMSGDGLIHEVFNGFAAHAEPAKAFRTPVTPIPTGSGNALAINLLGLEDAKDICVAALNAIKGQPMPVDLFSLTQGGERHISFMSQSLGLIADLDLGTEHLRFMGGQRFLVGFIYGLIRHRSCPVKVSIKVAHADKHKMVRDTHAARAAAEDAHAYAPSALTLPDAPAGSGLPPLQHADDREDGEGWITFDRPLVYLFAGKGPYVSSDVLQFPMSLPTDGLIDVTIQERTTRTAMFKAIDGSQRGEHFWQDTQHYYKAHAYRVEPLASSAKGWLSVDGEAFPLAPFQVEVHARLGTLLSMYGAYQLDFDAHGGGGGRGGKDRARP